ncbi:MAG: ABC transporter substrate-binding protein [Prevotellaceae bacterium]|nr:ABC transporter substrate-binding protein [Prevotellaceae bacterium]
MKIQHLSLLLFGCILAGCNGARTGLTADGGDTVVMRYARQLVIVKHDGYTDVRLADPWHQGKTLHRYILVPKSESTIPEEAKALTKDSATLVRTPLTRSIVFTSVHTALLQELHEAKAVAGVCDLGYMNLPWVKTAVKNHKIADCGSSMTPNIEKIIDTRPDALILSPFENSGGYGKLDQLHIPLIEAADYMETSALGRAEWVKFYGLLYGQEAAADSIFRVTDSTYHALQAMAVKTTKRPTVITELKTGGTWYVPGGESSVAALIRDAGAAYCYSKDKSTGSLSLSFEKVLNDAGNADFWLYKYDATPATLSQLKASFPGYTQMKAWQTKHVWGADCTKVPFYEETPFHPERVLRDFIIIFHPELHLGSCRYYHHVN